MSGESARECITEDMSGERSIEYREVMKGERAIETILQGL